MKHKLSTNRRYHFWRAQSCTVTDVTFNQGQSSYKQAWSWISLQAHISRASNLEDIICIIKQIFNYQASLSNCSPNNKFLLYIAIPHVESSILVLVFRTVCFFKNSSCIFSLWALCLRYTPPSLLHIHHTLPNITFLKFVCQTKGQENIYKYMHNKLDFMTHLHRHLFEKGEGSGIACRVTLGRNDHCQFLTVKWKEFPFYPVTQIPDCA